MTVHPSLHAALLRSHQVLHCIAVNRLKLPQFVVETSEFISQLFCFVLRWLRRNECAGFETSVFERAVKPNGKLPCHFQCDKGRSVISSELVVGLLAVPPNLIKELKDLPRDNALILKPPDEFILRLFCRRIDADSSGNLLGQQLGQLPKFQ